MRYRSVAAVVATGVLVLGGTAACSSSGGGGGSSQSPSPVASVTGTPNGVENMTAEQILTQTKAAAEAADSVKVVASVEQEGQNTSFDMTLTKDGSQGTVSAPQGSLQLIATPDTIYIQGDDNFNKSFGGDAGASLLQGKWLSVPKKNPQAASFEGFSSLRKFLAILNPDSTPTKVPPKEINGVQCVGLQTTSGTLWIAMVGEPYPMAIEPPSGQNGGITMSDWNASVTITPPPSDQVVDITQFRQSASPSPSAS